MSRSYDQVLKFMRVLANANPVGLNITIDGETGVGKEHVLRTFFDAMGLNPHQYVICNMAAIQPTLLESELFGHEKGSFTGAVGTKKGLFESRVRYFVLDEIASMPLDCQAKLLRAIECKEFFRVGGTQAIRHDLTFVSLTNVSLDKAVKDGLFRNDLMYRIADIKVTVPPLRERPEDVIELFVRFAGGCAVSKEAQEALVSYQWPGNVRQLKSVALAAATLARAAGLRKITSGVVAQVLPEAVKSEKRDKIIAALKECDHNITAASRALGVSRETFYRWVREHGLAGEFWSAMAGEVKSVE